MTALISRPSSAASGLPLLSITQGVHQGVSLVLEAPTYLIGCAVPADLILRDPGIAAEHLRLRFDGVHVAIEALGGDIKVIGDSARSVTVPRGNGHRTRLPLRIFLETVELRLAVDGEPLPAPTARAPIAGAATRGWGRGGGSGWRWAALGFLAACATTAFALRNEPQPVVDSISVVDPVALAAGQPTATLAEARGYLDNGLRAARLNGITVQLKDEQLLVQGSYDASQKAQWIALQKGFDSRYGRTFVLHQNVSVRDSVATPRVRFQAVWFGANPYVVNDSGKRLYPGAALADNWVIERIENNEVVLARGEERFTFTL
ncbi:SctD/MshK family protein [Pseudomonas sp. Mn2068]|uniref:SctD/MshK family protein n=1 Tax=Pseudomonas sp. Mn2068 TaxID=3395265 RepID=UPI003BE65EB9